MEVERIDLRGTNAYLADGETLVDAGWVWSAPSVRAAVEDAGCALGDIERVLVTHYDADHVGGLRGLADAGLDAPVYAAEPDASFLAGEEKPPLGNAKGAFQRAVCVTVRHPRLPVERVGDGDVVAGFEVHETPGHTPGHVAYLSDDAAFVGDAVRENGGVLEPMPSYMSYDAEEARRSARKTVDRLGDATAYVGHGDPVENAGEGLRGARQG
jgi:glyoxylase-like metal-dependent hydrolase (beta-lactamase superfamily II)